jgi:hypothetical protein
MNGQCPRRVAHYENGGLPGLDVATEIQRAAARSFSSRRCRFEDDFLIDTRLVGQELLWESCETGTCGPAASLRTTDAPAR